MSTYKLLRAFLLGFREGLGGCGMTYDGDAESPRSRAYDRGRTLRDLLCLPCVAALLVVALALMGLVWLLMGLAVALEVQP